MARNHLESWKRLDGIGREWADRLFEKSVAAHGRIGPQFLPCTDDRAFCPLCCAGARGLSLYREGAAGSDRSLRTRRPGRPTGTNPLFLNAHAAVDKFLGPARLGLGRKAGPLVFQFSPVPHPELRTLEARIKLFERITTFLAELRTPGDGLLLAAEFRNYELFTPRMMKRLRTLGVSPVIGLHPAMPGIRRQTEALRCWAGEFRESEAEQSGESDVFVPKASGSSAAPAAAADWHLPGPLVVRWSLAAHQFYDTAKQSWAPFDAIHAADPATRALIASLLVKAARSGQDSFLAVNNKAEGCAPKTVRGIAEIADRILEADRPVVR